MKGQLNARMPGLRATRRLGTGGGSAQAALSVALVDDTPKGGVQSGNGATISGLQLGTPSDDRWIAVGVANSTGNGETQSTGCTLNGIAASFVIAPNNRFNPQILLFKVPTGTTGTLFVQFNVPDNATVAWVTAITGASNIAVQDNIVLPGPNGTLDVVSGGLVLVNAMAWQLGAGVFSGVDQMHAWDATTGSAGGKKLITADDPAFAFGYTTCNKGLTAVSLRAA